MDIWSILQLEPTRDLAAIRRAYAQQVRTCHPEEDPKGFLRLREAYQAALAYAAAVPEPSAAHCEPDTGWSISETEEEHEPNPYTDHEAAKNFLELYTGKQRKNSKQWLDYFTSSAFLDAAHDSRFTKLLAETVQQVEEEFPPPREFLTWLYIAYQFTAQKAVYLDQDAGGERIEWEFRVSDGAGFDGIESIFQIAVKGPVPKPPRKNEQAIFTSFREYAGLEHLAAENSWDERTIGQFSQIIGRYAPGYITDTCEQRGDRDFERHPAGLRLVGHFVQKHRLPEELYRILWEKLELKSAILGRAKLLYGQLRELVLEHVPEIGEEPRESFRDLHKAWMGLSLTSDEEKDRPLLEEFFGRPDMQKALRNRRFIDENILHAWTADWAPETFLKKIRAFYEENPAAPYAEQVIERVEQSLRVQEHKRWQEADEQGRTDVLSLKNRSFFRHWLNTGFYGAHDPESGQSLANYLLQNLPYLPQWSQRFLNVETDTIPVPKSAACTLDGDEIEIRFHLHYIDFLLNGELVYSPFLDWDRLAAVDDTDTFCFLLPLAVSTYDRCQDVKAEICRRLSDTAAPDPAFIAACLAERVCCLPVPGAFEEPAGRTALLPLEFFAEDAEHLYGCAWFAGEQLLLLFEQNIYGRQELPDGTYTEIVDFPSAISLGRELLAERILPTAFPMEELKNLPEAVYLTADYTRIVRTAPGTDIPRQLSGEEVTSGQLETLLSLFAEGLLRRMEWSWPSAIPVGEEQECGAYRSLVFLREKVGYACLYFDDFRAQSYALLARPELYGKLTGGSFVPFRDGSLFDQDVHRSFASIRRQLPVLFQQVSWPNNVQYMAGGIWDYAVNVTHGRPKYNLDKQLLGGFPPERVHNNADARFYFTAYPASAVWTEGELPRIGELDRERLQRILIQFLNGAFPKLRLTWGTETGCRRHIVLLEDKGRFQMVWLDEPKKRAEFHVADPWTYMDVEGKKYPKDVFQGKTVPAYLIHNGITPLRTALEQLLANLADPYPLLGKMAEYAPEKPVKARPYEKIWAELVEEGTPTSSCPL